MQSFGEERHHDPLGRKNVFIDTLENVNLLLIVSICTISIFCLLVFGIPFIMVFWGVNLLLLVPLILWIWLGFYHKAPENSNIESAKWKLLFIFVSHLIDFTLSLGIEIMS